MKNFIFSALLALGIAGCAVSTAPTPAGNLRSLKSEIVNYTRQSSTAYVYFFNDTATTEIYTPANTLSTAAKNSGFSISKGTSIIPYAALG